MTRPRVSLAVPALRVRKSESESGNHSGTDEEAATGQGAVSSSERASYILREDELFGDFNLAQPKYRVNPSSMGARR